MNKQLHYEPRTDIEWRQVKEDTLKYCCGVYGEEIAATEEHIIDTNMPIWTALSSVGFNLNLFFSMRAYMNIQDMESVKDYLMWVCMPMVKPLSIYYVDWINGYIDFLQEDKEIAAGTEWHPENEIEILEYLYYCRRDEDIWWLLGQGIGSIKNLYEWYMGNIQTPKVSDRQFPPCYFMKDEKKALRMILYLEYNFAYNKAVASATRMLYSNADAQKCIWKILLPELNEDAWKYLADKYDLRAYQIYNVVLRYIATMDDLPSGWGMDLFSKISFLTEYCYMESHSSTK